MLNEELPMVIIEQDPNARFEKAIFNLIRSFNFIDLNVGLLISTIPRQSSHKEIYKKLSNKSFDQKMQWFKSLLEDEQLHLHLGERVISASLLKLEDVKPSPPIVLTFFPFL